jgi:very-short-patch-repair endonuclease
MDDPAPKPSTPEAVALRQELEKHGLKVLSELYDGHKHIDLAIPAGRINIEVDGRQHYLDPFQIMSDLKRSHYSDDLGYDTIHIPNVFIHENLQQVAAALAEAAKMREEQLKHKLHRNADRAQPAT